jgi:hypothetical protein
MSWNLEGQQVVGNYYGQTVCGTVVSSRVKYGGKVQHTVELLQAIQLRWRQEPTTVVLLDDNEIQSTLFAVV